MKTQIFKRLLKKTNINFDFETGVVKAYFENEYHYLRAEYDYLNQTNEIEYINSEDYSETLTEDQKESLLDEMHKEYLNNNLEYFKRKREC